MVYTESHSFKFSFESALAKIELKNKPVQVYQPLWDCDNFIRSVKASNRSLFKTSDFGLYYIQKIDLGIFLVQQNTFFCF
jgi:hypothetical protein